MWSSEFHVTCFMIANMQCDVRASVVSILRGLSRCWQGVCEGLPCAGLAGAADVSKPPMILYISPHIAHQTSSCHDYLISPLLWCTYYSSFLNEKATSDAKTSHSEAKRRRDDDDANLVGLQTSPSPSARGESEEPASKKPRSAAEGGGGLWAGLVQPVWKWLRGFVSKENLKERDMTKEGNRSQSICPSDGVVSPPVPPSSSCGADRVQLRNDSYDSGEPKVVSLQEKVPSLQLLIESFNS
jgi:hypothetical protein